MRIAGIVLLVLQGLGIMGGFAGEALRNEPIGSGIMSMLLGGANGIAQLIGYFLPTIIGVILLVKANKRKQFMSFRAARTLKIVAVVFVALVLIVAVLVNTYKKVGSYITFGTYPKTASDTGSTPIEWLVLDYDETNKRALIISRYGLDAQPYNKNAVNTTWGTCTLRTWLNDDFYNKAFTAQEQKRIVLTDVDNSKNQGYSGDSIRSESNTQDRIFLLSYAEANKYFDVQHYKVSGSGDNIKSRVEPTAYAFAQGATTYQGTTREKGKTENGSAAGWWWLRSPGGYQHFAAAVQDDGAYGGYIAESKNVCVRPALWIELEPGIF